MSHAGTMRSARLVTMSESLPDRLDAFEAAPTSLSLTDAHGRIIAANDAFWTLFGYDRPTALDIGMLSRDEDQGWTLSYLTKLVTGDIDEYSSVKRFVRRDGSEFDGQVTIRAVRRDGRCVGMVGHVSPVSVRPIVDDNRVRKLLEHSAGTLTLIDADGRVLETSGRYRATLGYPPEFWEDRTIIDLLVPEDAERVLALREEILEEPGRVVTGDFRVQAADRSIEHLEVTAVNMLHDSDLEGIVLSTRNVTAERRNTIAIGKLRDDAVAEAERRSHLLATVSHELRNPLHAMTGLAELLASDESLRSQQQELAAALHRQLLQLATVTDDLLDSARLEIGQFELSPTAVVIRDVLDDLVRIARSAAAGRIGVELTVDPDVPHLITTDPARLQQLLGNLLGNAVKFTDAGSVTLTVRTSSADRIEFRVADTGAGIPADELDHVFQAFSTASTSGDRRGAGLGLAIVHRLVDALSGTIEVTSEVGVGSTFTIDLPFTIADEIREVAAAPISDVGPDRPRVLVVEDTLVNQELARHQLERLGMEPFIAGSAELGLDLLATERFDAILMDHQLPGMNGRDATREIRRRGIPTPVIGVTASSTAADERACLDAGMDVFLPKPVGLDRLRSALAQVLREPVETGEPTATAADPGVSAQGAIDVLVLEALAEELGDRTIVEGLVRTFLTELDARRADIVGSDVNLAAQQAHTLKSSSRLLGAHQLSDACQRAEHDDAARQGIDALAADARRELDAWLHHPPPEGAS